MRERRLQELKNIESDGRYQHVADYDDATTKSQQELLKIELDKRGIKYKMKSNAFTWIEDPAVLDEIAQSILLELLKLLDSYSYSYRGSSPMQNYKN